MTPDEEPSKLVRLTPNTTVSIPLVKFIAGAVGLVTVSIGGYKGYSELQQSLNVLRAQVEDVSKRLTPFPELQGEVLRLRTEVNELKEWKAWASERLSKKRGAHER